MKNIHTSESHSCASNAGNHGLVLVSKTKSQEERCKTSKICEFCHRRYAFNTTKMHFKKFHSSENLIRCSYRNCCTYFRSEDEKLKHEEQKHAAANKRTCIFCNLFYSKDIMRSHLRETHKEQLLHAFKCTFRCPEFFLTETELNKHIECVHKKLQNLPEIKCIYCDKLSRDKNVLAKHINYKHSDVKILCKIRGCCQYFHTQTQLDSHSEQMHVNEKEIKRYKCSKCDFRSNQNYALNRHVAAKHQAENVENVVCRKCGKHFSSSTSLKNHIANVHTYSNVCEHCDKKIVKMSFHKIQSICKSCNQVLMCLQSAKLHNKQCKGKK